MIICPICKTSNLHLNVICKECGAYLQTKVENIDLFQTLWWLIENPKRAFKTIALAKHKNYVLLLTLLFGLSISYFSLEFIKIQNSLDNVFKIIILGIILSIPLSSFVLISITTFIILIKKIFRLQNISFKNIYSSISYAVFPLTSIFIILFPFKLLTFGANTFGNNPHPEVINKIVYWILQFLSLFFALHFIYLFIRNIETLFELDFKKSFFLSLITIAVVSGFIYTILIYVRKYIEIT